MNSVLMVSIIYAFLLSQQFYLVNCSISLTYLEQPVYDDEENIKFFPRIVGGKKAREGEVRSIVSLQTYKGDHVCGATWFQDGNQSHILTAAHCVVENGEYRPSYLFRVMGDDLSISKKFPGPNRQIRKVRRIIVHRFYNGKNLLNDIAMIFLAKPFIQTNTFAPIKLTSENVYDYKPCVIAGWGRLQDSSNAPPSIHLMVANVSVIPQRICNGSNSYNGNVSKNAFCAGSTKGGESVDSCQGDSGGGIFSNNSLIGIVSFGQGCALKNFPGVYTNVYKYKGWIRETAISSSVFIQPNMVMLATICSAMLAKLFFFV
ncbi:trypsin-3-like [Contarinia nasturtii]|uniref:trypsin-3-like n=1 Tax=Contarinia nasturtii TaxID=265458 RepID=UPI0012D489A7|nr:trypsin-3-like [Contarinia nasturtii]